MESDALVNPIVVKTEVASVVSNSTQGSEESITPKDSRVKEEPRDLDSAESASLFSNVGLCREDVSSPTKCNTKINDGQRVKEELIETGIEAVVDDSVSLASKCTQDSDDSVSISSNCTQDSEDLSDAELKGNQEDGQTDYVPTQVNKNEANSCTTCNKTFKTKKGLQRHVVTHKGERPFECTTCDKKFKRADHLLIHKRSHTGEKPHSCDECEASFTSKTDLNRHKKIHKTKQGLQRHVVTHKGERPFECTTCDKKFKRADHLLIHKRSHTGEKPHSCDECEASFTSKTDLNRHKKIHKDKHAYKCLLCGLNVRNSSALKTHLLLRHEGSKNYRCGDCYEKFETFALLNAHKENCESGEKEISESPKKKKKATGKKHKCDICSKSFCDASGLIRHKLIHSGEKPYSCDVCDMTFRQSYNMKMHRTTHLDDEKKTIIDGAIRAMKVSDKD